MSEKAEGSKEDRQRVGLFTTSLAESLRGKRLVTKNRNICAHFVAFCVKLREIAVAWQVARVVYDEGGYAYSEWLNKLCGKCRYRLMRPIRPFRNYCRDRSFTARENNNATR